jgi:hypothetical protein
MANYETDVTSPQAVQIRNGRIAVYTPPEYDAAVGTGGGSTPFPTVGQRWPESA